MGYRQLDPCLQLAIRESAETRRPMMRHTWRDLLFLHFPVDPEAIQRLLPRGLQVDVFPDSTGLLRAWVGLVAFDISKLAFRPGVRVPTASHFLETNVRTYVHRDGREPAVWFFSLDAQSVLACTGARASFGLPYWHADLSMCIGDTARYEGRRRADRSIRYEVEADLLEPFGAAEPGTLEFFLAERYLLYSRFHGRLFTGRVVHQPYPLRAARVVRADQMFTDAAGIQGQPFTHAMFATRVDVDVFAPEPCPSMA